VNWEGKPLDKEFEVISQSSRKKKGKEDRELILPWASVESHDKTFGAENEKGIRRKGGRKPAIHTLKGDEALANQKYF